jgi:hypothetical protein
MTGRADRREWGTGTDANTPLDWPATGTVTSTVQTLASALTLILQVGGFSPVPGDEDVELTYRAQARGVAVTWALDVAVRTSARRIGRAPGGFARHLRALAEQLDSNVRSATATPTDRIVVGEPVGRYKPVVASTPTITV